LMIAILLGAGLMGVAFAYLMGFVSYTAFTLFWLRKSLRGDDTATMSGNVGNFEARELVLFSLPLLFAFILSHIGIELHTILLGYFKNTAEVGLYSAALPFSQFISLPLTILLFMFLPVASQHWYGRNIEELQSVFKFVCRWIFIVSCSIFLALTLFSREIITVTFGSSFSPAHRALIILSVGYFFNALCGPTGALLLAAGESKKYLLGDLIGVGGALFLCLYLIPKMGVTGAAYAGMGQLLIVNIIRVIFIYQKAKIIPFSFRPFAGLLLMVGIVVVLKDVIYINNFVVKMVVFLGLYSIAIATTKAFRREDISFLSNLLIKRAPGKRLLCQGKTN
jgi:O-antigen/teichoic acid export membrane protein